MKTNPFSYLKNWLPRPRWPRRKPARTAAPPPAAPPPPPAWAPAQGSQPEDFPAVDVPFAAILQILPPNLQSRVCNPHLFGHVVIAIPTERILPQLASGDVSISFGELRMAVPDAFSPEPDADFALVPLPLADICHQVDPLFFENRHAKLAPPEPKPNPVEYALPRLAPAPALAGTPQGPLSISSPAPIPFGPVSNRLAVPVPDAPVRFATGDDAAAAENPLVALPEPAAVPEPLLIPLAQAAEHWQENVRNELQAIDLAQAQLALPMDLVASGLKQARLVFKWKKLRSWIQPAFPNSMSLYDQVDLELPLKMVAPLFLARQRETVPSRRKAEVDEEIPDLFFGSAPNAMANSVAAPAAANLGTRAGRGTATLSPDVAEPEPAVEVGEPEGANPNELVRRAASLKGVAGALVALSDGLLVASSVPPSLNPETVAAFLPAAFGKLSQYTQELGMGELRVLDFIVGDVPWKIIRLDQVFFASFGGEGGQLPGAALAALAAELRQD